MDLPCPNAPATVFSNLDQIRAEKQKIRQLVHQKETLFQARIRKISGNFSLLSGAGNILAGFLRISPWMQGIRLGLRIILSLLRTP